MDRLASVIKQFNEIQTRQALHEISIDEILQTLWAHAALLQRLESQILEKIIAQKRLHGADSKKTLEELMLLETKKPII